QRAYQKLPVHICPPVVVRADASSALRREGRPCTKFTIRDTSARIKKTSNAILAQVAAPATRPAKPKIAEMPAKTANMRASHNIEGPPEKQFQRPTYHNSGAAEPRATGCHSGTLDSHR